MAKKMALGKGIESLIKSNGANPLIQNYQLDDKISEKLGKEQKAAGHPGVLLVPVDSVKQNEFQPRKIFKDAELKELSQSIKENGGDDREQIVPVFSLTVGVSTEKITYTPEKVIFENTFKDFITQVNETVRSFPTLISDKAFNPFTQPVLYGKLENYKPSQNAIFFAGHTEKCAAHMNDLNDLLGKAFSMCEAAMTPFRETALEFFEGPTETADGEDEIETDVEVLKMTLSNLQHQQSSIKRIRDSRTIAFFKVDLRLFKRTILPNVSKAILKLQESLPRVGREKMEEFGNASRKLRESIEFEPKTTEEFVANMNIVEKMNEAFDILEGRLLSIENVYGIMNEIPIPISPDDKNSLKSLKSSMNTLAQKIHERIRAQSDVLPRFQRQLELEERALNDSVREVFKDVNNRALLEAEASIEEIKPTLKKIEKVLEQARQKVSRFNEYENLYQFPITEYPELDSAEKTLSALESLWNGIERWDRLYDTWSTLNFELLDVNDCRAKTEIIKFTLENAQNILGDNPVANELREKVTIMLNNLPTLEHLKTKFLKERHWKQISDIIGSDIKSHKITLGFLEQNNVFSFSSQVVRIIKSAKMEEQLDALIEDLKLSWTGQTLEMQIRHGIPTVKDFSVVNDVINKSMTTLKQLGSSHYSTEMRPTLQNWYEIVDGAKVVIDLLKKVQNTWLKQDSLLMSMTFEEQNSKQHVKFKETRQHISELFKVVGNSKSLLQVFQGHELLNQLESIQSLLGETEEDSKKAMWSVRLGSPFMFFLSDTEVEDLMCKSVNHIKAMEPFLFKIFPWFSSLTLAEGTDGIVTKRVS